MYRHRENWLTRMSLSAILVVSLLFIFFPFVWLLMTSLKLPVDAFAMPPVWIFKPTFDNFVNIFKKGFLAAYWNSTILAILTTGTTVVLGVPAGYSLSRARFRGARAMSSYLLLTRLAPPVAFCIPLYVIYRETHLIDTNIGLTLANLTITLPFVVWILSGFFKGIPEELEEAAVIDGCSRMGALMRVALPISGPGVATASILTLLTAWNQYFYPLLLGGRNHVTAPLMVQYFVAFQGQNWGQLAGAGLAVIFPVLIFTVLAQKSIVQGIMRGAIK